MPPEIDKTTIVASDASERINEIRTLLDDSVPLNEGPGITLKKPIAFDGKMITFISTDFSRLNGKELKAVAREYRMRFKIDPKDSFLLDTNYLLLVFARINEIDESFFDLLDGNAYLQLTEFFKLGMQEAISGN